MREGVACGSDIHRGCGGLRVVAEEGADAHLEGLEGLRALELVAVGEALREVRRSTRRARIAEG
jgi:hypothetical protein